MFLSIFNLKIFTFILLFYQARAVTNSFRNRGLVVSIKYNHKQCRYGLTWSSNSKFLSNPKNLSKNVPIEPPKVCAKLQVSSTSISLTSNFKVKVQVEPKLFFSQKCLYGPPKVCTKFGVSGTSLR